MICGYLSSHFLELSSWFESPRSRPWTMTQHQISTVRPLNCVIYIDILYWKRMSYENVCSQMRTLLYESSIFILLNIFSPCTWPDPPSDHRRSFSRRSSLDDSKWSILVDLISEERIYRRGIEDRNGWVRVRRDGGIHSHSWWWGVYHYNTLSIERWWMDHFIYLTSANSWRWHLIWTNDSQFKAKSLTVLWGDQGLRTWMEVLSRKVFQQQHHRGQILLSRCNTRDYTAQVSQIHLIWLHNHLRWWSDMTPSPNQISWHFDTRYCAI